MTTSIGYRWKGGNVRSRVVLIARQACAHASPVPGRGCNFFLLSYIVFNARMLRCFLFGYLFLYYVIFVRQGRIEIKISVTGHGSVYNFRWPWRRGPPLTIPNREVKTVCADGTAIPSGRVGSRLFSKAPLQKCKGAFLCANF